MSNNVNCQPCEVDYKKVVHEIQDALHFRSEDLQRQLQNESNPIRYIELKAVLVDVKEEVK